MKKTTRKLVLRKATIRELSGQALTHVIGGQETDIADAYPYSRPKQCLAAGLAAALDVPRDGGYPPTSGIKDLPAGDGGMMLAPAPKLARPELMTSDVALGASLVRKSVLLTI